MGMKTIKWATGKSRQPIILKSPSQPTNLNLLLFLAEEKKTNIGSQLFTRTLKINI